jgi:hypothetical protein
MSGNQTSIAAADNFEAKQEFRRRNNILARAPNKAGAQPYRFV